MPKTLKCFCSGCERPLGHRERRSHRYNTRTFGKDYASICLDCQDKIWKDGPKGFAAIMPRSELEAYEMSKR